MEINNHIIKQVVHLNYLGCDSSYDYDNDIGRHWKSLSQSMEPLY